MRSTLVAVLLVTAIAVGVSLAAGNVLIRLADTIEEMADSALETALAGDREAAAEELRRVHSLLESRAVLHEAVCAHDALHDVEAALEDAEKCLESGDMDDFDRAIGALQENLAHIREAEELKLSNLL